MQRSTRSGIAGRLHLVVGTIVAALSAIALPSNVRFGNVSGIS